MTDQPQQQSAQPGGGDIPHSSEKFGKVPQSSATFGSVPKTSEAFRTVQQFTERKENHTMTVREVAHLFEAAGVARTERSIVNWSQRDALGAGKLDSYFDPNERKYFITPESVEIAIAEEKAKAAKSNLSEPIGNIPQNAEADGGDQHKESDPDDIADLRRENLDLKITNRVKDQVIGMKDEAIKRLQEEHHQYIERLIESGHRMGELETKLLQLVEPKSATVRHLAVRSDADLEA